jgi:hypothetical protein
MSRKLVTITAVLSAVILSACGASSTSTTSQSQAANQSCAYLSDEGSAITATGLICHTIQHILQYQLAGRLGNWSDSPGGIGAISRNTPSCVLQQSADGTVTVYEVDQNANLLAPHDLICSQLETMGWTSK